MAKMTVRQVEALKPEAKPYKRYVDTGLMIRVATSGAKTWIVQYVVDGFQRDFALPKPWAPLSDDAHMSLADARSEAEKIRALARQGVDYRLKIEQDRQAEARRLEDDTASDRIRIELERTENLTVRDMFNAWLLDGVRRKDGNAELQRSFSADILPKIGDQAIKNLTEHELRTVLRAIVARGANRACVVMRNNLTQMFAWAEKRQPWRKLLANGDPMDLIEIEKIVSQDYDMSNQRERILTTDQIRELDEIFIRLQAEYDDAPNKRVTGRPIELTTQCAVWIMLSTLCRVGEMSMAKWEHVDLDAAEWSIPKENVKGGFADLKIYLSDFALAQFQKLHEHTGNSDWCFPARNKEGHVCVKSISKQIGDRQAKFKKNKDGGPREQMKNRRHDNTLVLGDGKFGAWTPHDLRRTGATLMQSLGVSLEIIDRCQNHVLPGSKVRRHYLHHDYADEKRNAWRVLGDQLVLTLQPQIDATI